MRATRQGDELIIVVEKADMADWMVDPSVKLTVTCDGDKLTVSPLKRTPRELDGLLDRVVEQYGDALKKLAE